MRDLTLAILFFAVYELLSLPLARWLAAHAAGFGLKPAAARWLARVLGPLMPALPIWAIAHVMPGIMHPAWGWLLWAAALVALHLNLGTGLRLRGLAWRCVRPSWPLILSLVVFLVFVSFRRWCPDMTHMIGASGSEKFPNAMLFWANWHAIARPPADLWFAGHTLAYYDFGHFFWAWIGRMSGLPAEAALTLALARAATLLFEATVGLMRTLRVRPGWAIGGALAATLGGPLSAVVVAWRQWRAPHTSLADLIRGYDFWAPSRTLDHVVDEFPAFTAILGDFHAHHLALPWLVAWVALSIPLARRAGQHRIALPLGLAWAFAGLAAVLANGWNLPVVLGGLGLFAVAGPWRSGRAWLGRGIAVAGLALLLWGAPTLQRGGEAVPLNAAGGPGERPVIEDLPLMWLPADLRSDPLQWLGLWGWHLLPTLLLVALWITLRRRMFRVDAPAATVLLALAALLGLLEFVYINDAFTGDLVRYNTYFKLSYPVWPVWAALAVLGLDRLARRMRGRTARLAVVALALAWAAPGLVYPMLAMPSRIEQARRGEAEPIRPTLNPFDYLLRRPAWRNEGLAVRWLREHTAPDKVVAEAPGRNAYSLSGRVASLAGRPVPMGWLHHEAQWRGWDRHAEFSRRADAVDQLYRADSPDALQEQARQLGVAFIIFGQPERERYGAPALDRLRGWIEPEAAFADPGPPVYLFRVSDSPDGRNETP